jgi:anhydro-N-acetylmuramic acid kinase
MRVLGMMSGTSADGIDVALVRISGQAEGRTHGSARTEGGRGRAPRLRAKLEKFACIPLPRDVRAAILRVAGGAATTTAEIARLNFLMGEMFARAAIEACRRFRLPMRRVDLIGSHGQTIYHQGARERYLGGQKIAATMQIGEAAVIAERTGVTTVSDFRPADMSCGGQGAPLVPFVDFLLYRDARRGRVALNIGGIANVTVIPAGARAKDVFAFDTGPGNMVIDALVSDFSGGKKRFDRDAEWARRGRLDRALLARMFKHPFFRARPPKSAGREEFGAEFVRRALAGADRGGTRAADLIYTATVFTGLTIAEAFRRWILPRTKIHELIVSGGGARNPLLMAQLEASLPGLRLLRSSEFGVNEDAKEAFAFAVLGYETFHGRPCNLPGATGARHPAILGKISFPAPQ